MLLKSMPSDKPSPRVSLLTIKNSSMRHKKDKSRSFFFNMTELSWSLTQEDANPKSTVDQVLEPDIKNLTDDCSFINYLHIFFIFLIFTFLCLLYFVIVIKSAI
jgi:hypothetical protein